MLSSVLWSCLGAPTQDSFHRKVNQEMCAGPHTNPHQNPPRCSRCRGQHGGKAIGTTALCHTPPSLSVVTASFCLLQHNLKSPYVGYMLFRTPKSGSKLHNKQLCCHVVQFIIQERRLQLTTTQAALWSHKAATKPVRQ